MFDSGVGGLSVLDALRRRLPNASLRYVGDAAFAPYGERKTDEIIARCDRIVDYLVSQGASTIVVACNTATVAAIDSLRSRWAGLVFVGVEPGVKPAAARSRSRRIAVMATSATARSPRLRHLIDTFARGIDVHVQPCPGLATAIEDGVHDGPELDAVLAPVCAEMRSAEVDTVVLGCTHYAFVASAIQRAMGDRVTLIDTATAVADRIVAVCGSSSWDADSSSVRIHSTGETTAMRRVLERCGELRDASVEHLTL